MRKNTEVVLIIAVAVICWKELDLVIGGGIYYLHTSMSIIVSTLFLLVPAASSTEVVNNIYRSRYQHLFFRVPCSIYLFWHNDVLALNLSLIALFVNLLRGVIAKRRFFLYNSHH